LTTGQQYTSTGVILVHKDLFRSFAEAFVETASTLRIGYSLDKGVFMGPMLSASARERQLDLQDRLVRFGARSLLKAEAIKRERPGYYLSPSVLSLDKGAPIDSFRKEGLSFGPDVMLMPFSSEKEGYELAGSTMHPFAASVFTQDPNRFDKWLDELVFGLVNHNLATTDMSMRLPLGGARLCGNHRPAGVFAQRNCTYPVSTLSATLPFDPSRMPPAFYGMGKKE
jgi:acyl-CoA reductase-like NAD-dependent aldehyde dehydrogenase